ncbi:hypothetical protein [Acanthopleuribacter pedis]|uniref:Transmembrane protein n=1 Tax=Acanthopleuribacter pedis TaxID=442870 RepID=A0A8J7QFE0_9BACT|nr:hypothetical protein [Acanthopleuribacter pedis]MBO1323074.1 hypothetical protein [Acanthopleuribacter pedis]
MLRLFPKLFIAVLATQLLLFAYQNPSDKILILKSGQVIGIDGDYVVQGNEVHFTLGGGQPSSISLSKVDLEKTEERNRQIAEGTTTAKETINKNSKYREIRGRNYQGLRKVVAPEPEQGQGAGGTAEGGLPTELREVLQQLPDDQQWMIDKLDQAFQSKLFLIVFIFVAVMGFLCQLIYMCFYFYIIAITLQDRFFWGMLMLVGLFVGFTAYLGWMIGMVANMVSWVLVLLYIVTQCHGRRGGFLFLFFLPILSTIFGIVLLVGTFAITAA